jgi:hypothetical protein
MRIALIALALTVCMTQPAFSDDHDKHEGKHEMDPKAQEMMKAWKDYATPSEGHKVLAGMAGNWQYTSKMWHKPEAKPEESTGAMTLKMILGGRFLENKTTGKAMGMPFEGLGFIGYNNISKKYETVWLDNMATGIMRGMGSYDASAQVLKDSGEFSCPMSKNKTQEYRTEWKIVDKNNMIFTMWGPDEEGNEYKHMEMTLKRKK